MPARSWLLLCCLFSASALADTPQQLASIGDLALVSGETLEDCRVGYRTAGTLNADKSNVLVFLTWFTGTSGDLLESGQIGPGKLADTDRYFVIAVDALGNGVSTSPSNSAAQPGAVFPRIAIDDMVESQHILLTRHLGIDHVRAVLGISMGGMQAFQWLGQYPGFMDRAVPIDGSPQMTSYDLLQWHTHATAIEKMQEAGVGNAGIMEFLAMANQLTLWTPAYIVERVTPEAFPEYLANAVREYAGLDARNYLAQLRAMMAHDVYADHADRPESYVEAVQAQVLIVGVAQDHMVNPAPGKALSEALDARYAGIDSECGHWGTSCEAAKVIELVHAFLDEQAARETSPEPNAR